MNETDLQELGNDYMALFLRLGQAIRHLIYYTVALTGTEGVTNSALSSVMEHHLGTGVWMHFSNLPYAMHREGLIEKTTQVRPNKNGVDQRQTCWRVP